MKRVFPRQSQALALMLAVSVTVVTPCASQAMSWNPMNWMPDKTSSQDVQAKQAAQSASQKAEEAQRAADEALKQAQIAKERADKAKEAADALNTKAAKKQAKAQKAVVTSPTAVQPSETTTPNTAPETFQASQSASSTLDSNTTNPDTEALKLQITPSTPDANASTASSQTAEDSSSEGTNPASTPSALNAPESNTTPFTAPATSSAPDALTNTSTNTTAPTNTRRGSSWNPTNWLYDARHDTFKEKPAAKASMQTPATQAPEATQPDKSGNRTPWNPMSWFGGDSATTAVEAPKSEKRQSAQEQTETPAVSDVQAEKNLAAVVETEKGNITFEFYPDAAPETVHNFIKLANDGFYNKFNMRFHRVIPGFVIQTGDPTGTGAGGAKERVPLEVKNKLSHNAKGVVAMARGVDPNSGTSQFYITLAPQTSLDGKYTIFGKVIGGMDVLDKIEKGDMMYGVKIVNINSVTRDPQPEKKSFFSLLF